LGITAEIKANEFLNVGLSYISDLADTNSLDFDNNKYSKGIDGLGVNASVKHNKLKLSAEAISALGNFKELDNDRNKPQAWNLELNYAPSKIMDWTVRYAGSKEIEDEPYKQLGISATWHTNKNIHFTVEYLRNNYKRGLVTDEQDNLLDKSKLIAGRMSILF